MANRTYLVGTLCLIHVIEQEAELLPRRSESLV